MADEICLTGTADALGSAEGCINRRNGVKCIRVEFEKRYRDYVSMDDFNAVRRAVGKNPVPVKRTTLQDYLQSANQDTREQSRGVTPLAGGGLQTSPRADQNPASSSDIARTDSGNRRPTELHSSGEIVEQILLPALNRDAGSSGSAALSPPGAAVTSTPAASNAAPSASALQTAASAILSSSTPRKEKSRIQQGQQQVTPRQQQLIDAQMLAHQKNLQIHQERRRLQQFEENDPPVAADASFLDNTSKMPREIARSLRKQQLGYQEFVQNPDEVVVQQSSVAPNALTGSRARKRGIKEKRRVVDRDQQRYSSALDLRSARGINTGFRGRLDELLDLSKGPTPGPIRLRLSGDHPARQFTVVPSSNLRVT